MNNPFYIGYGPLFRQAFVEKKSLLLPRELRAMAGARLLFVSDLHVSRRFPRDAANRLIGQIQLLDPDLLLIGGDFAESRENLHWVVDRLSAIRPPLGAAAVLGNNDMRYRLSRDGVTLKSLMERSGIRLLVNDEVLLTKNHLSVRIAGIDSLYQGDPPGRPFFTDQSEKALRILMAHYPLSAENALPLCVRPPHLGLCGHTHGGQMRIGPLSPYTVGYERKYRPKRIPICGWSDGWGFPICVSSGIGTSKIPLRIGARPTMHLITLTAE